MNILCIYILLLAYSNSSTVDLWGIDTYAFFTILISVIMILFGSMMHKSKRNGVFGVRTSWSQYNEHTWYESNFYGGIIMIVGSIISILIAIFIGGWISEVIMLLIIIFIVIISVFISYKSYCKEKLKDNK